MMLSHKELDTKIVYDYMASAPGEGSFTFFHCSMLISGLRVFQFAHHQNVNQNSTKRTYIPIIMSLICRL